MPSQNSFNIKQNTPEADRLERRVHDQLRKLWDPAADATVAKYLTAMVAKGYDRKKIFSQLKPILEESITVQLLDWLYKHLRVHGSDYQSTELPASSKAASKPTPSAAQPVPTEEVELRLEDLEAQQLEGSDLEDDIEANDTAVPFANAFAEAPGPSKRIDAVQPQQRYNGGTAQEGPSQQAVKATQGSDTTGQNGGSLQAIGKVERSERRHREPIPVPIFTEHPRALAPRSSGVAAPSTGMPPAKDSGAIASPTPQAIEVLHQLPQPRERRSLDQHQQEIPEEQQQQPLAPGGERRRLKSSVVLDWDSWHKQKQPADEQQEAKLSAQPGKFVAPERAPILARVVQDVVDTREHVTTSQHDRNDIRDRERGRERDSGSGRRRQLPDAETERLGSRHRDGHGEGDGGSWKKGGNRVHRSRSRSRSRSPRGRRPGRAPLGTANLLRSALREVDGLAAGSGARGSKPSVFERLGVNGTTSDATPARVSALQRVAGSDKADFMVDASGSGRKRGAEVETDNGGETLGSPPKVARGAASQKPVAASRSTAALDGVEEPPATGRQRLEHAAVPAGVVITKQSLQKRDRDTGASAGGPSTREGKQPDAVEINRVDASSDPNASELQALRQQLMAMQEKIARIEAAKEQAPPSQLQTQSQPQAQPQPKAPSQLQGTQQSQVEPQRQVHEPPQLAAPSRLQVPQQLRPQPLPAPQTQPQQQQVTQPQISVPARPQAPRIPVAGPAAIVIGVRSAGGMPTGTASTGGGVGGAGIATILPTSMSDVVIEGGSGSPPRRPASKPLELAPRADQRRLAAAQLDADLRSVVVENVHVLANQEVVAAHFSVAGPVKNVTLVDDPDKVTGQPTRVAIVEMATEQGTQAAAALTGSMLMDRPIAVTLKAVLMLQGMNLAAMGIDAPGLGTAALMPPGGAGAVPGVPGARLNPAAAPFVPGLGSLASVGAGGRGAVGTVRPPLGGTGGWQPWPKMGAGGRGRGSNVWVREAARPGNAVGSSVTERS